MHIYFLKQHAAKSNAKWPAPTVLKRTLMVARNAVAKVRNYNCQHFRKIVSYTILN